MPDKQSKVLKLNKTLYGLWRSPLLWQQKLTNEMKKLGFKKIPQEQCVDQENGIMKQQTACFTTCFGHKITASATGATHEIFHHLSALVMPPLVITCWTERVHKDTL